MDNYERVAKVFFDLQAVGQQAEIKGRFTNSMLKQIESKRVILNSMLNDAEMKPLVTRMLKVLTLWSEFGRAFNEGNSFDGQRIVDEVLSLSNEIFSLIERGDAT